MYVNYVNCSTKHDFLCNQTGEIGQLMYMNNTEWDTEQESQCQPSQISVRFCHMYSQYHSRTFVLVYSYRYGIDEKSCRLCAFSSILVANML